MASYTSIRVLRNEPLVWYNTIEIYYNRINFVDTGIKLSSLKDRSFTLEAFFQGASAGYWEPIFGCSHPGLGGQFVEDENFFIGREDVGSNLNVNLPGLIENLVIQQNFFADTKKHFAVIFDVVQKTLKIYLDYNLVHTSNNITGSLLATSNLWIGGMGWNSDHFQGYIGPERLSFSALTPEQFLSSQNYDYTITEILRGEDLLPTGDKTLSDTVRPGEHFSALLNGQPVTMYEYTGLRSLQNNLLNAPSGWTQFFATTTKPVGSLSVYDEANPPVVDGDIYRHGNLSVPSGYAVNVNSDGTFWFSEPNGNTSEEQFEGYLWRQSTSSWTQLQTVEVYTHEHLRLTDEVRPQSVRTHQHFPSGTALGRTLTSTGLTIRNRDVLTWQLQQTGFKELSDVVGVTDVFSYNHVTPQAHNRIITEFLSISDFTQRQHMENPQTFELSLSDILSTNLVFNHLLLGPSDLQLSILDKVHFFGTPRVDLLAAPSNPRSFSKDDSTVRLMWG
jgi:hypothetical protein